MALRQISDTNSNDGEEDEVDYRRVLSRGCMILIENMDPVPVVSMMEKEEFLIYIECRDIYEMHFTTDKNRAIVNKVRKMGYKGYSSFKRFLELSKQTMLVEYLERVEKDKETISVIETLRSGRRITNTWKGIKKEMIDLYQDYYVKTELSPLKPGIEIHVDDLYVPLQVEELSKDQNSGVIFRDALEFLPINNPKEVKCFREMLFVDDGQLVNTVFVIADPGVGKTTFCRKLISLWCNAHTYEKHRVSNDGSKGRATNVKHREPYHEGPHERENAETLKFFDFLFFVSLRHTSNEIMIEDMITNQLRIEKGVVKSILGSPFINSLIILDGLDEWSPPTGTVYSPCEIHGFPKSQHLDKCHILVTTRPWKLLTISNVITHKHKEVNIIEMKEDSSDDLIRLFLVQVIKMENVNDILEKFKKEIKEKQLSKLSGTPLLLKLLLCLWLEYGELQTSISHIYGTVVQLLIQYGLRKIAEDKTCKGKVDKISSNTKFISKFFNTADFYNIARFADILLQLANLSFDSLLPGKQDAKLIFRDVDLKQYDLDLELCSKLGILSQRPVIGKSLLYRERTVAFLHKSFQEFYAAMFMSQYPQECMRKIKAMGGDLDKILELSNVFKFLGEICPDTLIQLFDHISTVDSALDCSAETIRRKNSKVILSIAKDSLPHKGYMIKMNYLYLSSSDAEYCELLDKIRPEELKGITLECISVSHGQITRLLRSSPDLSTVRLCSIKLEDEERNSKEENRFSMRNLYVSNCSNIFGQISKFPYLRELCLHTFTLTHTQMACLFSDSPLLKIIELTDVECMEDNFCGCLDSELGTTNRFSLFRLCACLSHEDTGSSSVSLCSGTHVEILCISYAIQKASKGIASNMINCSRECLKHTQSFHFLRDLDIVSVKLTHSEITHLLSDSPQLCTVKMVEVQCEPKHDCGCLVGTCSENKNVATGHQRRRSYLHSLSFRKKSLRCDTQVRECTDFSGTDIFTHVVSCPNLRKLKLHSVSMSVSRLIGLLTQSPCLREFSLAGVHTLFETDKDGVSSPSHGDVKHTGYQYLTETDCDGVRSSCHEQMPIAKLQNMNKTDIDNGVARLQNIATTDNDDRGYTNETTNCESLLHDRIIRILRQLPRIDGLLVELDDIKINPEPVAIAVSKMKHIEHLETVKRNTGDYHEEPIHWTVKLRVKANCF